MGAIGNTPVRLHGEDHDGVVRHQREGSVQLGARGDVLRCGEGRSGEGSVSRGVGRRWSLSIPTRKGWWHHEAVRKAGRRNSPCASAATRSPAPWCAPPRGRTPLRAGRPPAQPSPLGAAATRCGTHSRCCCWLRPPRSASRRMRAERRCAPATRRVRGQQAGLRVCRWGSGRRARTPWWWGRCHAGWGRARRSGVGLLAGAEVNARRRGGRGLCEGGCTGGTAPNRGGNATPRPGKPRGRAEARPRGGGTPG